jgi:hypothetical protein
LAEVSRARFLGENLAALAKRQPVLAAAVSAAVPDPRFVPLAARSGVTVPGVRTGTGTAPLHSLYDPAHESAQVAGSARGSGCVVACGLGGGYHVAALLQDPGVHAVIVVEKEASVLRALFEQVSFVSMIADTRLLLTAGLDMIREAVVESWQPALMGAMRTVQLRAWGDTERAFFDAAAIEIEAAVDVVRADYGVQSHFGKRWLTNIILNLGRTSARPPILQRDAAAVTAAGPSLESQLPRLAADRAHVMLIATDTSLPALLRSGIHPDGVLSIDCQNHGYHHFLQGIPEGTALFLDCASPPLLSRLPVPPVFVASGHPFVQYVDSNWRRLLQVDTSGGNVTHAAVSLARALGARQIEVYGADFSYPDGKAYARGTYLYDYFESGQSRVAPAEASFYSFVHSSAQARREQRGGSTLYTTAVLTAYKDRFVGLMDSIDAEVIPIAGNGLALPRGRRRAPVSRDGAVRLQQFDPPRKSWHGFLSEYASAVERLPAFSRLASVPESALWATMFPVAARVVREGFAPGVQALEEARRWSLERISRVLQAPTGEPRL